MDYLAQLDLGHGWILQRFATLESTNTALVQIARQGGQEGICFAAEHQSAGKGRLGRQWDDEFGRSLLASVLCFPNFDLPDFFALTAAMSLAAIEALDRYRVAPAIKWPNDIMVGEAKMAGILAETGESGHGRFVVVGIGMNVNQSEAELAGLGRPATSLGVLLASELSTKQKEAFEIDLLQRFQGHYLALQSDFARSFARLLSLYRARCSTLHSFVRVNLNDGESISGRVLDVSNQGQLLVELDSCIRSISAGDVEHLYR